MTGLDARVVAVAILGAIILGALLAWLQELSWASPGEYSPPPEGPAAWEVSQLIEEARRITREASE